MPGILLIDKPEGITSFAAVSKVRRAFGEKKAGHTGTLDPMATGVLPVLLGSATKLSDYMLSSDKRYLAEITLGYSTDTLDVTGNVTERKDFSCDNGDVVRVLKNFVGEQMQLPPAFSALKIDGKKAYELARKGEAPALSERKINIFSIDLVSPLENGRFSIEVSCSKGTYIRSLCRDIGISLGTAAVMSKLKRLNAAGFDISDCISLETATGENGKNYLLPAETAVMRFPVISVTEKQAVRFSNGGELDINRIKYKESEEKIYRVKSGDTFIGLGFLDEEKEAITVKCLINAVQK